MAASKRKRFALFSWVENGGDGSANIRHTITEEAATKKDEAQDERWGESSVHTTLLEYEEGKLYLIGSRFDGKQMVEYRLELPREAL